MGKESRLRNNYKPGETRQQYSNGDKKLYDRDACPSGLDEYVWHLTLYFEQKLERYPTQIKRPIIYTELYHRISSDKDLTSVLDTGTMVVKDEASVRTHPHATVLKFVCPRCNAPVGEDCYGARATRNGEPYRRTSAHMERHQAADNGGYRGDVSLTTNKHSLLSTVDKVDFIQQMIDVYFSTYSSNTVPSIDDFTNYSRFNLLKEELLSSKYTKLLVEKGTRIPVIPVDSHPDRRSEKVQEVLDITVGRVYTEQEMEEKFTAFRRKH